jgi:hypothetical protein
VASPHCDNPHAVDENIPKKGVKGVHPLGCLPLWGREGVTLAVVVEIHRISDKTAILHILDHKEKYFADFCQQS